MYKAYYYHMVMAGNHVRVTKTSIYYIYKVFKHIPVQWMDVSMHPYFIKAMNVS